MVIWVQVHGVQGFDKDQIALVIPDLSDFAVRVPIIIGTQMISCIINVIKEIEIDVLAIPWVNAWMANLLSVQRAAATVKDDQAAGNSNLSRYNEVVLIKNTKTIDAFSSCVIIVKAGTAFTSERIDVMTQALLIGNGSLPWPDGTKCLYQAEKGEQNVIMVVRNSVAYPQTLSKKTPVARSVMVTWVPEPLVKTSLTEVPEEDHDHQMPKSTVKQKQEKLFEELDLSGLESWPPELVASAQSLLAKDHDIFSLEPTKLGCTHSTEHAIKVTDDTPFKE